jgi:hypothetical protein
MKGIYILMLAFFSLACNNDSFSKAEDAEEAGTEFIRACLDGNFKKADFYLYEDANGMNAAYLEQQKKNYNQMPEEDKINYKQAGIRALQVEAVNDSTVNYIYTNSYKPTDTTTIKIVKVNDEWLVDLKDIH